MGGPKGRRKWEWEQLHVYNDYEKLYSLDVLEVEDPGENDQLEVLHDIKESVVRKQNGSYEVGFPCITGVTLTNTRKTFHRSSVVKHKGA